MPFFLGGKKYLVFRQRLWTSHELLWNHRKKPGNPRRIPGWTWFRWSRRGPAFPQPGSGRPYFQHLTNLIHGWKWGYPISKTTDAHVKHVKLRLNQPATQKNISQNCIELNIWGIFRVKSLFILTELLQVAQNPKMIPTRWCPPGYKWIYKPINYRYITYKP